MSDEGSHNEGGKGNDHIVSIINGNSHSRLDWPGISGHSKYCLAYTTNNSDMCHRGLFSPAIDISSQERLREWASALLFLSNNACYIFYKSQRRNNGYENVKRRIER